MVQVLLNTYKEKQGPTTVFCICVLDTFKELIYMHVLFFFFLTK